MANEVYVDAQRGKKVAELLHLCFSTTGIHGKTEMPEDIAPVGVLHGSLEHIMFITLTVSIDYQRDADVLWASSRKTYEDTGTQYLFTPEKLHEVPFSKIKCDMQKYKLSKKTEQDPYIWQTVGITFYKKWQGDPRYFLASCGWDAPIILNRLREDSHIENGKSVPDFPFLRGDKIGPLWLRMLRDNVGLSQIQNMDKVPIPVDVHVARATLAIGVVSGEFKGRLNKLFETIRQAWFESVRDLTVDERPMIALDVDEPLWHLSKYGCTYRDKIIGTCPVYHRCEAKEFCIKGKVSVQKKGVDLDT